MTTRPELSHLLHPVTLKKLAQDWLLEDTPAFDYGGFVVGEQEETAYLLCKSPGVLAGAPFFDAIFRELDCQVEWFHPEGASLEPVCKVAAVKGKVRHLLLGERVALNCLARASGVATAARRIADLAKAAKWHGEVAGTRKTTPGFRLVEKYAMLVGGAATHRYDLSSMIMLKDNHIWSLGNISTAVREARRAGGFSTKIEVECRCLEEALEAAQSEADVVMLDNFSPQGVHTTAQAVKTKFPQVLIEASGGISEENVTQYLGPFVDVVSLGSITQVFRVVDFSLKITRDPGNSAAHNGNSPCATSASPSVTTPTSTQGRRNFAF
ncbi:nicotinate-nucleotide pyrophosphorylase [carboxylating] [Latimeria chalumnae]|uniref:Nicotinate-nucleotide pyrophosphorylase [carboxylating] n=1 Tax=Latimeria chalumnae TaxID=7897 RepID=H2ZYP3_LATCH|nr:PREDICTED: nicotinate-nucleotide pyrophosphorylase [carboxylating] [Latimeria chalumnae]|eukprot:XP_006004856.1 PREDICTED: nicotinate-nucleotide pyrophosphorylase [carboxylating] [Latimeria chalumnae]